MSDFTYPRGSYRTERAAARRWRLVAYCSLAANAVLGFLVAAYCVGSHAWWN